MQQEAEPKNDWKGVSRRDIIAEAERLRETVRRLLRQAVPATASSHGSHRDDAVPAGWAERHGITIPRADGIHESSEAWIRVKNGVIIGAWLKNQSILLLMISLDLLDQGAEHHGNLYKDWRAAFFSRLDPTKSGKPGGGNLETWSKEDRYSKLIHRLDKDSITAMDGIVAARPKGRHLAAFQARPPEFVEIVMRVVNAMRDINREAGEVA